MDSFTVVLLRVGLAMALATSFVVQVLLPATAHDVARDLDEVAHLATPYATLAIVAIAALQLVALIAWHLLGLAGRGALFTRRTLPWIDAAIACVGVATALGVGVFGHLLGVVQVGGPAVVFGFVATVMGGLTLIRLALVLRRIVVAEAADAGRLATHV